MGKNFLDKIFDAADKALDGVELTKPIGSEEEEEQFARKFRNEDLEWKFATDSNKWHCFKRETDNTICDRVFENTHNMKLPSQKGGVVCCNVCMARLV